MSVLPADKIDDLLRSISDLASALTELKKGGLEAAEAQAQAATAAPEVSAKPYAVIEIQRFYNDDSPTPVVATKKSSQSSSSSSSSGKGAPSYPCAQARYGGCSGRKCPFKAYDDEVDEEESQGTSVLEAFVEFIITVGPLLWLFWILSNLPVFVL